MLNDMQYAELKDKQRAHIFTFDGKAYDPNMGIVANDSARLNNEQTSQVELYEFITHKPSQIICYVKDSKVTTWIGDQLGRIIYNTPLHNTFARHLGKITVLGDNGILYYGISSGNHMSCNLRAYKNQQRARNSYWMCL